MFLIYPVSTIGQRVTQTNDVSYRHAISPDADTLELERPNVIAQSVSENYPKRRQRRDFGPRSSAASHDVIYRHIIIISLSPYRNYTGGQTLQPETTAVRRDDNHEAPISVNVGTLLKKIYSF